jgi:hypothetical protein
MPTLIAALALSGLLKIAHLGIPQWHLAFFYSALVMAALFQVMPLPHALLNGTGTFLASWLYFWLLDYTDVVTNRFPHYFVLVVGMVLLLGSRFWIDIRIYGIGL